MNITEFMAPPSYEEVIGVHPPSFSSSTVQVPDTSPSGSQDQPITQPLTAAIAAQSSTALPTNETTHPPTDPQTDPPTYPEISGTVVTITNEVIKPNETSQSS